MRVLTLFAALPLIAACAVQPGNPVMKAVHGGSDLPAFEELNYALDFGRRCSPPDASGRSYGSVVWLRANNSDGTYGPLRASERNCDEPVNAVASAD